jgi:hypothetical protein
MYHFAFLDFSSRLVDLGQSYPMLLAAACCMQYSHVKLQYHHILLYTISELLSLSMTRDVRSLQTDKRIPFVPTPALDVDL